MPKKTHACPRCGQTTQGSYSPGGLRWAICDTCMTADREVARDDEQRQGRQGGWRGWYQGKLVYLETPPIKEDEAAVGRTAKRGQ